MSQLYGEPSVLPNVQHISWILKNNTCLHIILSKTQFILRIMKCTSYRTVLLILGNIRPYVCFVMVVAFGIVLMGSLVVKH